MPASAGRTMWVVLLGAVALICAATLALHVTTQFELELAPVALGAVLVALVAAARLYAEVARTRIRQEKVSEELDILSQTLLRIEASLAALDGSGSKANSALNDVAGDVHSLSQVVKTLAEAMALQDREITTLRQESERPLSYRAELGSVRPDIPAWLAPSVVPSFLPPARDAATAALVDHLGPKGPAGQPPGDGDAVASAAAAGEVDLHAQAVVNLPQRRERIFELYPLLRVGEEALLPHQYASSLERAGAGAEFELGLVGRGLVFAHRLAAAGSDARVSVPLSGASLAASGFLRRLDTLIEDHGGTSGRLVLELEQQAWQDLATESEILGRIRRAGVGFTLRAVTDENLNPPALARLGVRHVRLSAERLLAAIESDGAHADMVTLVGALARSGIEVIADGVEDEVAVPELIDIGVPLAQGLALALPCPVEAILERPPRPPGPSKTSAAPDSPKPDGSGPPQGSLRDFLRRAG